MAKKGSKAAKQFRLIPKARTRRLLAAMKIRSVLVEPMPKKTGRLILNVPRGTQSLIIRIPMGRMCNPFTIAKWKGASFFDKLKISNAVRRSGN
jgi:hypothetical protein